MKKLTLLLTVLFSLAISGCDTDPENIYTDAPTRDFEQEKRDYDKAQALK